MLPGPMPRDPALRAECRDLQQAIVRYRTLNEMRAGSEWPSLAPRIESLLHRLRRYEASPAAAASANGTGAVRAVHWNIEHGNWYDRVEEALLEHPKLRDADLYTFNEIDLGMARAGNRDVTGDLAGALNRHAVWVPLFLETTLGRDDDLTTAGDRTNEEGLFGIALLSRWPIGEVKIVDLPSPADLQFELERMIGRHVGLIAEVLRPGAPFLAVTAHLEVHRTRRHRAVQMQHILDALRGESRPVIFAGDWNTHTIDRAQWHSPFSGALTMLAPAASERLLHPDRGPDREMLFERLRAESFTWEPFVDYAPTLQLRLDRIEEVALARRVLGGLASGLEPIVERRGRLRLDWFAGRGWSGGTGETIVGLDGPGRASDHAPITATFVP